MKYWPAFGIVACVAAAVSIWQWVLNGPVLSYGDPAKTYFNPAVASPGDKINLCFDDISWFKICPSALSTYLQPPRVHRRDFPNYNISTPLSIGKVPPKCRPFIVPDVSLIDINGNKVEGYGIAEFTGHATHFCALVVKTALPKIKLEIVKKIP